MRLSAVQLRLLGIGVVIGLLLVGAISYKTFDLAHADNWWDGIKNTTDYQSILAVNALIGLSVVLMVLELRLDALRVLLTVIVALIFGYLMTAFFNLDAADRFIRGEFRVKVISDAEPLTNINYGEQRDTRLTPNTPFEGLTYRFTGSEGDVVNILAFAAEERDGIDLKITLSDGEGNVLQENASATRDQTRAFRRYLSSEKDAIIEAFVLPATSLYVIDVQLEPESQDRGDFTVALLSDTVSPIDLVYNGDPAGDNFNATGTSKPLQEAEYQFTGRAGDTVNVLAYVFRKEVEANLQVKLYAPDGTEIGANNDATSDQVQAFAPDLKSTDDAVIQGITLPADGIYTIHVQPEPLDSGTKFEETIAATNKAYDAFLLGPLSRLNRWIIWIRDALTLIILGLSIAIVFRAEQFSLGAEGQLYFGALVSGAIGLLLSDVPKTILVPFALLSAATAGFLWGLLPGALKAYLGANELVSTLMLNMIASRFYEMVLTFQFKPPDAGFTASGWIEDNGLLTPIIDLRGDQVSIAVFILIGLVLLTWLFIQRTPLGYEIRMIGANRKFADYGGVNTKRTIMLAMAISGAVAGLAGAHLALGIHRRLILNISTGLAFEGVVVALLARNNPLVVPFTGLLYSYLRTGAQMMERDANISAEVVRIIQAVVILLITAEALVTFFQRRRITRRGTIELDAGPGGEAIAPAASGGANG
jgi:simple sugar transport system permease protein